MALEASFLAGSQFSWLTASCSWQLPRLPPCIMSGLGGWMLLALAGLTTALWPAHGWYDGKWLWTLQSDEVRRNSMKITNDMAVSKNGILGSCCGTVVFWGSIFFWRVVFYPSFMDALWVSLISTPKHMHVDLICPNALLFALSSSSQPIDLDRYLAFAFSRLLRSRVCSSWVCRVDHTFFSCLNFCSTKLLMGGWSFTRSCGF